MEKTEILVVCANPGILETILRLLQSNTDWNATGAPDMKQATSLVNSAQYGVALLGSGLSSEEERTLELEIIRSQKKIAVIKHYGGGSGLLFGEIFDALARLNS